MRPRRGQPGKLCASNRRYTAWVRHADDAPHGQSGRVTTNNDPLTIAGKQFRSRLIVGTGKYRTMEEMRDAIDASGAEMVTVAIRRLPLDRPDEPNLMDHLDWKRYTILPNTAGCKNRRKRCSRPAWPAS